MHHPHRTFIWATLALTALLILPAIARAQEDESDTAQAATDSRIKLELMPLLTEADTLAPSTSDGVWNVTPTPGRMMFQLPITVTPGDEEFELTSSSVKVTGARFLTWRIAYTTGQNQAATGQNPADQSAQHGDLPPGTPRMARRLTVTPQGTIKWKLERFIPNGTAGGSSPYAMKINPALLNQQSPGEPPNITRNQGEDERAYQVRRIAEQSAYRAKRDQYVALRRQVMDLPSDFEVPIPPLIWGVYEIRSNARELSISGPADTPWDLDLQTLNTMRSALTPAMLDGGGQVKASAALSCAQTLYSGIAQDAQPLRLRSAAYALSYHRLVRIAEPGDPMYQLAQVILEGHDVIARRSLIKDLVSTIPPTQATTALLKLVASEMDPTTKLMSLGSMLHADIADPFTMREVVSVLGQLLADPSGPDPSAILEQLAAAEHATPETLRAITSRINIGSLPDERLDKFIRMCAERAPQDDLAALWLDQLLLGSTNTKTVGRTLELLDKAVVGGDALQPVVGKALGALFGASPAQAQSVVRLERPILVPSVRHNLYRVLQSGDARIRALAWQVLRHFTFGHEPLPREQWGAMDDRYRQLTMAALGQRPTPMFAVDFLLRQPDRFLVATQLVHIALAGDGEAADACARALIGFDAPLSAVFVQRSYNERQAVVARIYATRYGQVPLVTNVLRHRKDDNPVLEWLSKELASGAIPDPGDWAAAFRSQDDILELIPSNDQDLGVGAVAALVCSVGGSDEAALKHAQEMRAIPNPTVPALRDHWAKVRHTVFMDRVKASAGDYNVALTLTPPQGPSLPDGSPAPAPQPQVINLGQVQFVVGGDVVEFRNIEMSLKPLTDRPVIEIGTPADLKKLDDGQALSTLPIESVIGPLYLVPRYDRTWRCRFTIESQAAELVLTPVGR